MKRIAISQRVTVIPAVGERRDALDQRWYDFLLACGAWTMPIPNHRESALGLLRATRPDGILLSGGNSLVAYGGDAPERDRTEAAMVDWAIAENVPVVGVCRGMQIIQDRWGVKLQRVDGHVAPRQTIEVRGRATELNSYHDWGAVETVPDLEVWAVAADGVVEAVRHTRYDVQGIMWHPERFATFRDEDLEWCRQAFRI